MLEGVYDGGGIMMGRSGDNQQARGVIKGGRRAESWARLCSAHSEDRADSDHCQNEESDERSSAPLRPLDLRTAHRGQSSPRVRDRAPPPNRPARAFKGERRMSAPATQSSGNTAAPRHHTTRSAKLVLGQEKQR